MTKCRVYFLILLAITSSAFGGRYDIRGLELGMTSQDVMSKLKENYPDAKIETNQCLIKNRALPVPQILRSKIHTAHDDNLGLYCKETITQDIRDVINPDYGEAFTEAGSIISKTNTYNPEGYTTSYFANWASKEKSGMIDEIRVGFAFPPNDAEAVLITRHVKYMGDTRPTKENFIKAIFEKYGKRFVHSPHTRSFYWVVDAHGNRVERNKEASDKCKDEIKVNQRFAAENYSGMDYAYRTASRAGHIKSRCGAYKLALAISFHLKGEPELVHVVDYHLVDLSIVEKLHATSLGLSNGKLKYINEKERRASKNKVEL